MSINVTVSGNPVSIKRGKMVTIGSVSSKEEYDKRRIMRLEQVRQQSRDIAGKVRNKVHKEKMKQMKKIQEEGRDKFEDWKNRKLLELQCQYKEALKEFASGHEEAKLVEKKFHDSKKEDEQNKFVSLQRGREAGMRLQIDKNKENLKRSIPLQSKKLTRDSENARAALISKSEKSVSDKKNLTSINISIDSSCDADSQDFENVTPDEMDMSPQESNEGYESPRQPLKKIENIEHMPKVTSCSTENNLFLENLSEPQSPQPDTRISDQIKNRNKHNFHSDYCDTQKSSTHIPYVADNVRIRSTIHSPIGHLNSEKSSALHCTQNCQSCLGCDNSQCVILEKTGFNQKLTNVIPISNVTLQDSNNIRKLDVKKIDDAEIKIETNQPSAEIPLKAPVKIKDVPLQENHFAQNVMKFNKVQYYDHCNKFLSEKDVPVDSFVEKLGAESVEAITDAINGDELLKERDREANLRGRKALATERVKKDYEDMMKRLPVLQKREKILELKRDKPEHHMSGNRLKNVERIRQNKLENAFNKIFPGIKPATITLPKINKELENDIPEVKNDESIQSIDLNKCKIDKENQKNFSVEEVQEIISSFTQQKCEDRKTKLKELLNSLKLQKDELIKELKGLARGQDDSINDLINDLISFDSQIVGRPSKIKDSEKQPSRKRRYAENDPICENIVSSSSTMSERLISRRSKKDKTVKRNFASRKKSKSKAKYIILQNAGTQTTPKASVQSTIVNGAQIKASTLTDVSTSICKKKHIPCECKDFMIPEELCRILINLNEEKPALVVESDYLRQEEARNALNRPDSNLPFAANDNKIEEPQLDVNKKLDTTALDITDRRTRKPGKEFEKRAKQVNRKAYKDKQNTTSWRDHLGKFSASTSSTSYMSPPDIQKPIRSNKAFSTNRNQNYDLQSKSMQNNLYDAMLSSVGKFNFSDKIHPHLAEYIEKLLGMSRGSIENLNISSTSSVTTPSQSLIELESNNPISHFQELLKQLSSKIGKVAKELSVSPDQSPIHFNTSVTTSEEIGRSIKEQIVNDNIRRENGNVKLYKKTSKEGLLEQYAEITDSCSKRIASLTAMIQQIRNEKIEILHGTQEFSNQVKSPLRGDKELSSAYIDSSDLKCSKNNLKSSSSTSLSTDEEDILGKLLDIDVSLARKLKKLKDVEVKDSGVIEGTGDFQERLECLTKSEPYHDGGGISPIVLQNEQNFFSFLSDIPKLPKYQVEPDNAVIKNHKRPPPSKGISIAKKFNENILLVPHELSTIVEADSQLSTKMGNRPPSPIMSKSSPIKDIETSSPEILNKITENQVADKSAISEIFKHNLENKMDSSVTSTVGGPSHSKTPHTSSDSLKQSSSSYDDIETIEVMLKSIGMDWAIPTLHKTKEALALSSSSSSSFEVLQKHNLYGNNAYSCDINFLKSSLAKQLSYKISTSNSVSNDSLKSLLAKQLSYKISSSNSVSDSPVSFLREFSNFSAIQANSKEQQRTSTPLTTSKSNDADVFSIETDISSVKCTVNQS